MKRGGSIYIMTNKGNTTLYIGVTSDLKSRVWEHKNKVYPNSFTSRYNLFKLVYFENFTTIEEAIGREKQLKRWHREWKYNLIKEMNPEMIDLSESWGDPETSSG